MRDMRINFEVLVQSILKRFNGATVYHMCGKTIPDIYNAIKEKVFGFVCFETLSDNFTAIISGDV